jgi:hypothetical protein
MATVASVVINDGTTNLTFAPVKRDGVRLTFLNKVGTVVGAFKAMSLAYDMRNAKRKTDKVNFDLDIPLERTENGIVMATNVVRVRCAFTIPEIITDAERTVVYNLTKNGVAHAVVLGYVNGDPML